MLNNKILLVGESGIDIFQIDYCRGLASDVDFVKINENKLHDNFNSGVKKPWKCCRDLIVTRGGKGADLYNNDGEIVYHSDALKLNISNTSVCVDSFLSALTVKFLETSDIKQSMDFANKVSDIASSKPGVVAVTKEEVEYGI